ncbi:MAG: zinc-binding dehydrogenase [Pseudomonadales bacterium]|nr:zinc-binding dehydrogenase [Pseudomonadales bacterium]NRA14012.1 zinc-binding dehydrogenase [Oceanospirillaceae bacterium]
MKKVQINKFGSAHVAEMINAPIPVPKAGQLLVKLKACSVNPVDAQIRQGHYRDFTPLPFNLGFDGAGIVEAAADDVVNFRVGDSVYFVSSILNGEGTYAQYCIVDAELAALIPDTLDFNQAAALSLVGSAAWESLIDRGRLQAGETVLIHAGAGGVGHIAIQIAKAIGAKVIATAKQDNLECLKSLGADIALDYQDENFNRQLSMAAGTGVELVLDTVAGNTIADSAQVLAERGRIVSLADYCPAQNLLALWPKNAEIHLVFMTPSSKWLNNLNKLVDQGKMRVIIDKIFPFEKVVEAHEYLQHNGRVGKIILAIS